LKGLIQNERRNLLSSAVSTQITRFHGGLGLAIVSSRLVAIFFEDPMLAAAAAFSLDEKTLLDEGRAQLQRLVEGAASVHGVTKKAITVEILVGNPHKEILLLPTASNAT
jgi:hypothetical protein